MFYSLRRWNYEIKAGSVGPSPAFYALYAETGLTYEEMIEREIGKVGYPTVEMGGEEYFEDGTGERGVFCFAPFILDCSQMNARALSEAVFFSHICDWEVLRPVVGGVFVRFSRCKCLTENLVAAWFGTGNSPLLPPEMLDCPIFHQITRPATPAGIEMCERWHAKFN
jgi:hypothetical protein